MTVSSELLVCLEWYIHVRPGRSGAEVKYTLHAALPKWHINWQSRQLAIRAYYSNFFYCTVIRYLLGLLVDIPTFFFDICLLS